MSWSFVIEISMNVHDDNVEPLTDDADGNDVGIE